MNDKLIPKLHFKNNEEWRRFLYELDKGERKQLYRMIGKAMLKELEEC